MSESRFLKPMHNSLGKGRLRIYVNQDDCQIYNWTFIKFMCVIFKINIKNFRKSLNQYDFQARIKLNSIVLHDLTCSKFLQIEYMK